ncbi:MAG TPA: hypothetical protein VFW73_03260 [Lacipirellulaceae bacterium]|nr:hypothetical protein [Lacipirellulaceae bacterium]
MNPINMSSTAKRTTTIIAALAVIAGCQSGPRWAWWKHDKAPDSSVVARSAEPALPSAQTTPQAVAVAGLTPAAPPSSANLAAAGAGPPTSNIAIPVTSSATVANAPSANYSAGNSLADKITSAPVAKVGTAIPSKTETAPMAASTTTQQLASVPSAGPYDPTAYKPETLSKATERTEPLANNSDRYGLSSENRYSTSSTINASPQPLAVSASNNPYATSASSKPLPESPTTPVAETGQVSSTAPDRYASTTPTILTPQAQSVPTSPAANTSALSNSAAITSAPTQIVANTSTTVQASSIAGQYRPGGTSTYTGLAATPAVEIATRPSPVSAPAPAQPSGLGKSSEQWAPPVSPMSPSTVRAY